MQVDPRIERLAQAIAKAEGFGVPDTVPTLAHNPGDLVIPGWSGPSMGAGISVFDDDNTGWQRLYHEIGLIFVGASHVYNLDMTIMQMAEKWTMTDQNAWANNVADFLRVNILTTLRELLQGEQVSPT